MTQNGCKTVINYNFQLLIIINYLYYYLLVQKKSKKLCDHSDSLKLFKKLQKIKIKKLVSITIVSIWHNNIYKFHGISTKIPTKKELN